MCISLHKIYNILKKETLLQTYFVKRNENKNYRMEHYVYVYMITSLYPEYSENLKNSQKAGNPVGK